MYYNDNQRATIAEIVKKLFHSQDKTTTGDKLQTLIDEVCNMGFDYETVLKGLNAVMYEDLPNLKFKTVRDAIRSACEPKTASNCQYCEGMGIISMVEKETGRGTSLACNCILGMHRPDLVRWNGKRDQLSKNRWLEMGNPYRLDH